MSIGWLGTLRVNLIKEKNKNTQSLGGITHRLDLSYEVLLSRVK